MLAALYKNMNELNHLLKARIILISWSLVMIVLFFVGAGFKLGFVFAVFILIMFIGNAHIYSAISNYKCGNCGQQAYMATKNYMSVISGICPHCGKKLNDL